MSSNRSGNGSGLSGERRALLCGIAVVMVLSVVAIFLTLREPAPVVVTHWANGHMMNTALLPRFAEQFNKAGFRTRSGTRIEVRPVLVNSGEMTDTLVARVGKGAAINQKLADPTIITPAADHWLRQINFGAGRTVVDPGEAQTLAITWVGIVTYREMAECLGWPNREIGIADIVALRTNPDGWASCRTAKVEWGKQPLMSFTDPSSSSTARSMLFALYSMAAGKAPEQLTQSDVTNPEVVGYVKRFQSAVDHYVPDTLILNSKIYLGPRYGHFFFISESNLVQLYQGKLAVTVGAESKPQPLSRDMVFIYPREGATAHNHSASIVRANWVSPEQSEAAQRWISYLREDEQQRAFMEEGFRPATHLPLSDTISSRYGLDPNKPTAVLNPDTIEPTVAAAIVGGWDDVKKPGIATFVVDVSGSMAGAKLDQAKQGLTQAVDAMNSRNRAGLISFSDTVIDRVPIASLAENRFKIGTAIQGMRPRSGTALYDAVREAIEMTDAAPGDDDAIRGVVVITDGQATSGTARMHDLIRMTSPREVPIVRFSGLSGDSRAIDEAGGLVDKKDLIGTALAMQTRHRIHVFFVGIGKDADLDIGRLLAEATGSAFQGTTEGGLARVIELFGKYF
jgi:Ca-activated chloride channel homolog